MIAVFQPDPAPVGLSVSAIRHILGRDADGLSDDQVLKLNEECASFAALVCDLALESSTVEPIQRRKEGAAE